MNTLTMQRDPIGRFATKQLLTRFAIWLLTLPFQILGWAIRTLHRLLAAVLPSRRTAGRILWYQFIALGWILAAFFAHQHYVVRCGYNMEVHGWFMTQEECDNQSKNWFNGIEIDRVARTESMESQNCVGNSDLCGEPLR